VAGALVGLGLFTFQLVVVVAVAVCVVLARVRPNVFASAFGLLAGVGALSLYIAFLQRQGPGTVCWQTATAAGCDEYLNPLPWLVVGVALVAGGIGAQVRRTRHRHLPTA
jgi:hypothetical protein